jgi:hypothetical protein
MHRGRQFAGILGALALAACAPESPNLLEPEGGPSLNEEETSLTIIARITANGYWKRFQGYQWTATNTASASALPIAAGQTKTISYNLDVTRSMTIIDDFGVDGKVCLTTYTGVPEDLNITGSVQFYDPDIDGGEGGWVVIPGVTAIVDRNGIDEGTDEYGGRNHCYKYTVSMTSEPHQTVDWLGYQFITLVFIGNLPTGEEYLKGRQNFFLPTEPEIIVGDEFASLTQSSACPEGFTCTALPPALQSPVALSGSASYAYSIDVTNPSGNVSYGAFRVRNRAVLSVGGQGGRTEHNADSWMEYSGSGIDASIWSCNAGFWRTQEGFPYWGDRHPHNLVGGIFPASSAYLDRVDSPLDDDYLVEMLHRNSVKGKTPLDQAAIDLLREAGARMLNIEYQGGDASALIYTVNSLLTGGDRIAMLDLAGQLRGQNFAGTCRLL